MEQILKKLLDQAVKNLTALEGRGLIEFKIFTLDGEEFGKIKVAKPKPKSKKRSSPYPHGELTNYVTPFMADVKPDQVLTIPVGKYDAERIRSNACSWATTAWGKGTYSSTVPKDKKHVEIYRFPV
jgi:hypothetical protein